MEDDPMKPPVVFELGIGDDPLIIAADRAYLIDPNTLLRVTVEIVTRPILPGSRWQGQDGFVRRVHSVRGDWLTYHRESDGWTGSQHLGRWLSWNQYLDNVYDQLKDP